ncbi:MAG: hypothetical protein M1829_004838 [Trizodia sp. TS-e1964]|nr:MAG: hypothetical protein M1829_004838 [Trizodia sp. TS-e1964]
MKFAHEFQAVLKAENFPVDWVDSAISYGQLKKCIKRVKQELAQLGLQPHILNHLLVTVEGEKVFRYSFAGNVQTVCPKLVFLVGKDGIPIHAQLSSETKLYLQTLAATLQSLKRGGSISSESDIDRLELVESSDTASQLVDLDPTNEDEEELEMVEIPLTADSEFFLILRNEISNLETLQTKEEAMMQKSITELGRDISKAASPSRNLAQTVSKTDLYRWRQIFDLYIQAGIFFSSNELDHGQRDSATALKQLQWFSNQTESLGIRKCFKMKESLIALDKFLRLNMTLVQNMKFQEINQTAMQKILKKFDKYTALGARTAFPTLIAGQPFLANKMSKAICFKVSNELLSVIPQLADYLCPVCFDISYLPIRLSCQHVFCIREAVVMEADSGNIDHALANFLKKYFPAEVKAKQKDNLRLAGIDAYGESFDSKCDVM